METQTQNPFSTHDVTSTLKSLFNRCDRFDLCIELSKHRGTPQQAAEAIQKAKDERKVRVIKIGKGDSARFDVEAI